MSYKDSKGDGITDFQLICYTLYETMVLLETIADCVPKEYVVHDWRRDLAHRIGLLIGGLKTCSALMKKIQPRPITPKEESKTLRVERSDFENILTMAGELAGVPFQSKTELIDYSNQVTEKVKQLFMKYFPASPPTKNQTEKECKNPDCRDGHVIKLGGTLEEYVGECPDCQKDQAIQEERKEIK